MKLNDMILNSKVCLFLGAGASAPFGLLLMDSFVDLISGNYLTDSSDESDLMVSLCKVKNKDLENILEELNSFKKSDYLSKMKDWGFIGTFCSSHKRIRSVALSLEQIIRKGLIEHYRDCGNATDIIKKYTPIFNLIGKPSQVIPVFTTNYDNVIDELCCSDNSDFNLVDGTCYKAQYRNHVLDFKEYESFKPKEEKINLILFKLHGSICWELDKTKRIIRVNPRPMFDDYDPDIIKYYIAPTKDKIADSYPYRNLYEYLLRCLDKAKLCIVIGYSFRDYDTLTKFKSALDYNPDLHIVIFNDKAEVIKKNLFDGYEDRIILVPYLFGGDDEKGYLSEIQKAMLSIE